MSGAMRIAILGATGHVGTCLAEGLGTDPRFAVVALARNQDKLRAMLDALPGGARCEGLPLDELERQSFDAIVNCIGEGDPGAIAADPGDVLVLTERIDARTMSYLLDHPAARLVNFSSGAAYGGAFDTPVRDESPAAFPVNALGPSDAYGVAKLASEMRHRAASGLAITDLRLFGFFSRHIDASRRYFMNDVVAAVTSRNVLRTGAADVARDYVDPTDLTALVAAALTADRHNDVFDVYSTAAVRKSEVLLEFAQRYGLKYSIDPSLDTSSATGHKLHYYSLSKRAERLGYTPRFSSIETLVRQTDAVLRQEGEG